MTTDTTTEAAERLAMQHSHRAKWGAAGYEDAARHVTREGLFHDRTAATLRALAAERDAALADLGAETLAAADAENERDAALMRAVVAEAERDAAVAREARMRAMLEEALAEFEGLAKDVDACSGLNDDFLFPSICTRIRAALSEAPR